MGKKKSKKDNPKGSEAAADSETKQKDTPNQKGIDKLFDPFPRRGLQEIQESLDVDVRIQKGRLHRIRYTDLCCMMVYHFRFFPLK